MRKLPAMPPGGGLPASGGKIGKKGRRAALEGLIKTRRHVGRVPRSVASRRRDPPEWRKDAIDSFAADGFEQETLFPRPWSWKPRSARDSSFVENVGTYHPRSKPAQVNLNKARIEHWLKKGAKPSNSVRTLARQASVARSLGALVAAPAGAVMRRRTDRTTPIPSGQSLK